MAPNAGEKKPKSCPISIPHLYPNPIHITYMLQKVAKQMHSFIYLVYAGVPVWDILCILLLTRSLDRLLLTLLTLEDIFMCISSETGWTWMKLGRGNGEWGKSDPIKFLARSLRGSWRRCGKPLFLSWILCASLVTWHEVMVHTNCFVYEFWHFFVKGLLFPKNRLCSNCVTIGLLFCQFGSTSGGSSSKMVRCWKKFPRESTLLECRLLDVVSPIVQKCVPLTVASECGVYPLCSEISCNVKWNVYLAMEIPDRVSFVSGQNGDEIVPSCELSWRFFSVEPALKLSYYYRPAQVIIIRTEEML